MDNDIRHLLEEALKLPNEARAALVDCLIGSLDEQVDEGAARAWEVEIAQRLRELRDGSVQPIPWSEARRIIAG